MFGVLPSVNVSTYLSVVHLRRKELFTFKKLSDNYTIMSVRLLR